MLLRSKTRPNFFQQHSRAFIKQYVSTRSSLTHQSMSDPQDNLKKISPTMNQDSNYLIKTLRISPISNVVWFLQRFWNTLNSLKQSNWGDQIKTLLSMRILIGPFVLISISSTGVSYWSDQFKKLSSYGRSSWLDQLGCLFIICYSGWTDHIETLPYMGILIGLFELIV